MIGWLQGSVISKQGNTLIVNVAGIGYEVTVPLTVIETTDTNQDIELFIHHAVREDGHYLYGFINFVQRQLFRELIRVSGIGPKSAVLILSGLSVESFIQVIKDQNSAALMRLPGIGKKTAERMLVELNDRVNKQFPAILDTQDETQNSLSEHHGAAKEAVEALIALELKPQDAQKWVDLACRQLGDDANSGLIIKTAFSLKLKGAQ